MVARSLHFVKFCALIIVVAASIIVKNADTNTMEDRTEPTDSRPSLLRHRDEKKDEQPTLANLA